MLLRKIKIENFRGIRRLKLKFDLTTVVIGENNSGKTSIFDALAICLGAGTEDTSFLFRISDFHHSDGTISPTIRIELTFWETEPTDWQKPQFTEFGEAVYRGRDGRGRLDFLVEATLSDHRISVRWGLVDERGAIFPGSDSEKTLLKLRRLTPVLVVRGSYLSGRFDPDSELENLDNNEQLSLEELEQLVENFYARFVASGYTLSEREAQAGFNASRALISKLLDRSSLNPGRLIPELLKMDRRGSGQASPGSPYRSFGAGTQKLGLLFLLGALLQARIADLFFTDAEPVLVIEEPEAHLHPMMLATVWQLIEAIDRQKIVSTNSGDLLEYVPLQALRRLERKTAELEVWRVPKEIFLPDEMRKVMYHIRARRGTAFFARCWLLVEGETEYWLLPELARLMGYDFALEGIACVEFAQCGIAPIIKLATALGIEWHLLVDGDHAGHSYAATAASYIGRAHRDDRITILSEDDIEHCMWYSGYDWVYRNVAGEMPRPPRSRYHKHEHEKPRAVIERAIRKTSKPFMALAVLEAISEDRFVPEELQEVIEKTTRLARL